MVKVDLQISEQSALETIQALEVGASYANINAQAGRDPQERAKWSAWRNRLEELQIKIMAATSEGGNGK